MKEALAAAVALLLLGCASLSRGYIYETDEVAVGDSTYVYGYAIVGRETRFQIVFENVVSKERKTFSRKWADNGVYKEHLFAHRLPHGLWRITEISTGNLYREYTYGPKKLAEIRHGFGNFLGSIDAQTYPISESCFEAIQMIRDKEKTDILMKERYPGFNPGKTVLVEYKEARVESK